MGDGLTGPPSVEELKGLGLRREEVIGLPSEIVWRVHACSGENVLPWNYPRTWGPVLRFDHQPRPLGIHPEHGIWYGAAEPRGSLAEVFQETRLIDRFHGSPYLTAARFTRKVRLLDVGGIGRGAWLTRAGAQYALDSAPHRIAQEWSRAIHQAYEEIDGIAYRGRFAGGPCVALFERGADALPERPELSLPLSHPGLHAGIATAAIELGYTVL